MPVLHDGSHIWYGGDFNGDSDENDNDGDGDGDGNGGDNDGDDESRGQSAFLRVAGGRQ